MRISEIDQLSIPLITRRALKAYGFSKNAACSAGRCYEFQDVLYNYLKKYGYNPKKIDSHDWANSNKSGYAEANALLNDNHAWIYVDGKHYDSLDLDGASRPSTMKFFAKMISRFRPDDEEQYYQLSKHNKIYDLSLDKFIPRGKISKEEAIRRIEQSINN